VTACRRCGAPLPRRAMADGDEFCSRYCCEMTVLGYSGAETTKTKARTHGKEETEDGSAGSE
jgi:uncharacterized Zn finger protein (UPF0148 family)